MTRLWIGTMGELVSDCEQRCSLEGVLSAAPVIGDNESQIMKMISQLPKETGSV